MNCRSASPVRGVSWLPNCSRTFLTASDSVTDCRTSVASRWVENGARLPYCSYGEFDSYASLASGATSKA